MKKKKKRKTRVYNDMLQVLGLGPDRFRIVLHIPNTLHDVLYTFFLIEKRPRFRIIRIIEKYRIWIYIRTVKCRENDASILAFVSISFFILFFSSLFMI